MTDFWKTVERFSNLITLTSLVYGLVSSFIGYNPLGPIVGLIIVLVSYFIHRYAKRIIKGAKKSSKRITKVVVLVLITITSIFAIGVLRSIFPPNISITNLQEGDITPWKYTVKGTSSFETFASHIWPEGLGQRLYVYVLIFPVESNGPWWVQDPAIVQPNGDWEVYCYFGRDPTVYPEDIGDSYRVCAIITREKLRPGQSIQYLSGYLSISQILLVKRS